MGKGQKEGGNKVSIIKLGEHAYDATCNCTKCTEEWGRVHQEKMKGLESHDAITVPPTAPPPTITKFVNPEPNHPFDIKCYCPKCEKEYAEKAKTKYTPPSGTLWTPQTGTSLVPTGHFGHRPHVILSGRYKGKKWELFAASISGVRDRMWEFDLVVNCTGTPEAAKRKNTIPRGLGLSLHYVSPLTDNEIVLDWPDYGIPVMPLQFWRDLLRLIKTRRRTVVFCMGGHGRTGTALSILVALHKRMHGAAAVKWVRKHHCSKAVENAAQKEHVVRMSELAGMKKPEVKAHVKVQAAAK